jgi:hypothetical protein
MYIWIQQWHVYKGFLIDIHLKRSELYLVFGFELKCFKFCFCSSWRCTSSTALRTASSSARSSTRRRVSTLRASPGGHFVKHNFGHFFRTHFFIFKHIFVIYETLTFFGHIFIISDNFSYRTNFYAQKSKNDVIIMDIILNFTFNNKKPQNPFYPT